MRQLLVKSSPHLRTDEDVPTIMWCVVAALVPAWLAAFFYYGWCALALGVTCMALCVLFEYCVVYIWTRPVPKAPVPRQDEDARAVRGEVEGEQRDRETNAEGMAAGFFSSERHRRAWRTASDGSAAVTGLLFAMILKPNTLYWVDINGKAVSEWYVVVFGCFFAIFCAKHLFGGLGCNIWNPALAARAFVQVSYGKAVNGKFLEPFAWVGEQSSHYLAKVTAVTGESLADGADAISQSTPLEWYKQGKVVWSLTQERLASIAQALHLDDLSRLPDALSAWFKSGGDLAATGLTQNMTAAEAQAAAETVYTQVWHNMLDILPDHWLGATSGCMGETAAVLLLLGGVFLWFRGYIDLRVPLGFMATVAILSLLVPYRGFEYGFAFLKPEHIWYKPLFHLGAGGLMIGAWFMATDMATSPVSKWGNLIFGMGCGVLTVVIRQFAAYPEGVCYAILIMNTTTPLIDRYTKPRVYGTGATPGKEAGK